MDINLFTTVIVLSILICYFLLFVIIHSFISVFIFQLRNHNSYDIIVKKQINKSKNNILQCTI